MRNEYNCFCGTHYDYLILEAINDIECGETDLSSIEKELISICEKLEELENDLVVIKSSITKKYNLLDEKLDKILAKLEEKTLTEWVYGATYEIDDLVTYENVEYVCIQSHTVTDKSWTPDKTPALWSCYYVEEVQDAQD